MVQLLRILPPLAAHRLLRALISVDADEAWTAVPDNVKTHPDFVASAGAWETLGDTERRNVIERLHEAISAVYETWAACALDVPVGSKRNPTGAPCGRMCRAGLLPSGRDARSEEDDEGPDETEQFSDDEADKCETHETTDGASKRTGTAALASRLDC